MSRFALMATAKGSKAIVNKSGERGHPCHGPLERLKYEERRPFVMTAALGLLYIGFIHLLKPGPIPNFDRATCRKPHSTLPKAFSASSETVVIGTVLEQFNHIKCRSLRRLKVSRRSTLYKAYLISMYNVWQNCFQPKSQYFSQYFTANINETDWSEISSLCVVSTFLRDQ